MMESAQPDDPFADPSVTTAQDVHVEIGNAPAESHSLLDDDPPAKPAAPTAAAAAAEPQPAAAAAAPANTFCGCFSVAYYKPFFDVDTEDIQARIKTVAIPERDIEKHAFLQLAADRPGACAQTSPLLHCRRAPGCCDARRAAHTRCLPSLPCSCLSWICADMYGPFWICTTLVFSMAVTSNFASWWAFKGTPALWTYDFSKIVSAASLIYGYQVIMPVAVWFIGRYLATPITVTQTLCLFGYSTLAFIPATVRACSLARAFQPPAESPLTPCLPLPSRCSARLWATCGCCSGLPCLPRLRIPCFSSSPICGGIFTSIWGLRRSPFSARLRKCAPTRFASNLAPSLTPAPLLPVHFALNIEH